MSYIMGIDVGTSSLKALIADESGAVKACVGCGYHYNSPSLGYAEQHPETWWNACVETIRRALKTSGLSGDDIAAVGFSGQMHGAVMLDANNKSVRPAILHCDARSGAQVQKLKTLFGQDIPRLLMNPIYTGFMLPSLLCRRPA